MALGGLAPAGFSFAGGLYEETFIFLTPTPQPGRLGGTLRIEAVHGLPSLIGGHTGGKCTRAVRPKALRDLLVHAPITNKGSYSQRPLTSSLTS